MGEEKGFVVKGKGSFAFGIKMFCFDLAKGNDDVVFFFLFLFLL